MSTAFATFAGHIDDVDPRATVEIAPQRNEAAARELADQMPYSHQFGINEIGKEDVVAHKVTDRIGANWGRVNGVVVLKDTAGTYLAVIGDIVGVDTMTVQFANGRRMPVGRIVAIGMD